MDKPLRRRFTREVDWRYATAEDARVLAELNFQLIADEGHRNPMDVAHLEQRMRGWLAGEYRAVLFERESRFVAYALFRQDESGRVNLRQFFVVRGARRGGVGREAMALLCDEIVPAGKRIVVEVLAQNPTGRAFWHAMGFHDYALVLEREP